MSKLLLSGLVLAAALLVAGCTPADPVASARESLAIQRPRQALEALRDVVESGSEDPEVHYLYGVAMAGIGQPNLGQWSLRKAMEDPEWLVPAGIEVVRAAILAQSQDAAVEVASRVLEAEPDNMEALLLRSRAHIDSRRDYEGALADADRALALDPDESEALIMRAVALLGLERVEEAELVTDDLARRFAELDMGPEMEVFYCTTRAAFAAAKGEVEEADERFGKCLELGGASPLVIREALGFYDGLSRPERSPELLRAVLDRDPAASAYRREYASRLRQARRFEEARDVLLEGTQVEADGAAIQAWADLGNFYIETEDFSAAASAVDRAVGRIRELGGEPDPQLRFQQAETLMMAGQLEEALELARGIQVPVYRSLAEGRVFLEQGRNAEALEKFSEGLLLWPENAVARYYAAIAAERNGEIDRAIGEYRYSIRADASATDARLRLARLHAAEGDAVRSEQALNSGRAPLELEHRLEGIRLAAQSGRTDVVRRRTAHFRKTPAWGRAVAAVAQGMGARRGPEAAARVVLGSSDLDLTLAVNAEALRVLVIALSEMGKAEEASPTLDAALENSPENPVLHMLRGRVLESVGAPAEEVRAAYEHALELDAEQVEALEGLARLAIRAGSPEQALDFYARAAAADDEALEPLRSTVELLITLGRAEAAEEQLVELVERDPYDADGLRRLAGLRIARGAESGRTLVLARQAVRFQGGPQAEALLIGLEGQKGEPREPTEATRPDAAAAP
jgi:tetratricopeptide (TPR) repeat protein